jgi:N-acetylmuramoyl-L-alanine amidase
MRLVKFAAFLLTAALTVGSVQAQDEAIARAYRTVNVRSGPSTQYEIVGQLTSGSEALIDGRSNEMSDWLRIDFRGVEGWVAYFTVTVLGDLDDLPVVVPRFSLGEPVNAVVPTPTPTPFHAPGDVFVTTYRRVNVRSGPGSEYTVIGSLETSNSADVTGRTIDDEWLRIDFDGTEGWVAYFVVSLSGSLADVETVDVSAEPVEVVTRYNVNLHRTPELVSSVIGIVPYEMALIASARSDSDETWLQVRFNGQDGWLMSNLVSVNGGDPANLPIEQP